MTAVEAVIAAVVESTPDIGAPIAAIREQMAQHRRSILAIQWAPVPEHEIDARARNHVADRAEVWRHRIGRHLREPGRLCGASQRGVTLLPDGWDASFFDLLCVGDPESACILLSNAARTMAFEPGLPSEQRAAATAPLERELAAMEAAEEAAVDAAIAVGFRIAHRVEVVEARAKEQARRAREAREAMRERTRQAAAEGTPREPRQILPSQYLQR